MLLAKEKSLQQLIGISIPHMNTTFSRGTLNKLQPINQPNYLPSIFSIITTLHGWWGNINENLCWYTSLSTSIVCANHNLNTCAKVSFLKKRLSMPGYRTILPGSSYWICYKSSWQTMSNQYNLFSTLYSRHNKWLLDCCSVANQPKTVESQSLRNSVLFVFCWWN